MFKSILVRSYSLIELSVVLTVISLVISSLVSLSQGKTDTRKIDETTEKMLFIEKAIANYLAEYGCIPCPADATIAVNATNFGVAKRSNTFTTCSVSTQLPNNSKLYAGSVPTATLQISDDYAYDSWGRRFTYVMSADHNTSNIQYLGSFEIQVGNRI